MAKKSLKGSWLQVGRDFFFILLLICALRWALVEPYVVPSGSMIPTLLVKDYIVASKFSYGLRVPFTKTWLLGPYLPERGDVVVFKSKDDQFYFMVKRVVGLPGDQITLDAEKKQLMVNGEPFPMDPVGENDEGFKVYMEQFAQGSHEIQYGPFVRASLSGEYTVPEGHVFMMGDNRDRSSDSRVWGSLPLTHLMGKAQWIWMSCDETAPLGGVLCLDEGLRKERLFTRIK